MTTVSSARFSFVRCMMRSSTVPLVTNLHRQRSLTHASASLTRMPPHSTLPPHPSRSSGCSCLGAARHRSRASDNVGISGVHSAGQETAEQGSAACVASTTTTAADGGAAAMEAVDAAVLDRAAHSEEDKALPCLCCCVAKAVEHGAAV